MSKPAEIKQYVFDVMKEVFNGGVVVDGKLYLDLNVNGEDVQVAVAVSVPKTRTVVVEETVPAVALDDGLTKDETNNLAELMSRLGL